MPVFSNLPEFPKMSWLRLMEESIKENEPSAEAGETPLPGQAANPKRHGVAHLIREMWPAYLIEIFVIILGISITLALEEWRDGSKERQLEKVYLKNLSSDMEADLHSLNFTIAATDTLIDRGNELLAYIKDPVGGKISSTWLNSDLVAILARPRFISADASFSDLKNSGNLHLVKNISLKNLLFTYYGQVEGTKEIQDAEQAATINLSGPYFLKRFPLSGIISQPGTAVPEDVANPAKSIEFDNMVYSRVASRKELQEHYKNLKAMAVQLKQALDVGAGD
jgi:hypothetical protein